MTPLPVGKNTPVCIVTPLPVGKNTPVCVVTFLPSMTPLPVGKNTPVCIVTFLPSMTPLPVGKNTPVCIVTFLPSMTPLPVGKNTLVCVVTFFPSVSHGGLVNWPPLGFLLSLARLSRRQLEQDNNCGEENNSPEATWLRLRFRLPISVSTFCRKCNCRSCN